MGARIVIISFNQKLQHDVGLKHTRPFAQGTTIAHYLVAPAHFRLSKTTVNFERPA